MTWLTPMIAAVAAAVAIPALVILYFLKLRRRDVEISSTFLWKKAIQDLQANAPFQKLRRNILLLLQLLALGALLAAVGQPQLRGVEGLVKKQVLLIDASASMRAKDATDASGQAATRLDAAKEAALGVIDSMAAPGWFENAADASQAMVVVFDRLARIAQPFTADKQLLRKAIQDIQPSDVPTSVAEAWQLVEAQAPRVAVLDEKTGKSYQGPPGPVGHIHLFSDGRLNDPETMTPHADDGFTFHPFGKEDAANVAIVSVRAARSIEQPNQLSVFVGLQSTARVARTQQVELLLDGVPLLIKDVAIDSAKPPLSTAESTSATAGAPGAGAPGSSGTTANTSANNTSGNTTWTPSTTGTVFTLDRPQGGVVGVRLVRRASDEDTLDRDDRAFLVVPPAKQLSIAVVTKGSVLWPDVLAGKSVAKFDVMSPAEFEAKKSDPAALAAFDVWVLDGIFPLATDTASTPTSGPVSMLPGRFLVLNALPPPGMGVKDLGAAPPGGIIGWKRDHPALRGIVLDGLLIGASRLITLDKGAPAKEIATSEGGPAILDVADGSSRAIVVCFDPMESNWPFLESFPVTMSQCIDVLGDVGGELGRVVRTGDILRDRVPLAAKDVRVILPGGGATPTTPASDGQINVGPLRELGIHTLQWDGPRGPSDGEIAGKAARPFAVNLLDAKESDITPMRTLNLASREVRGAENERASSPRRLWPWLVLSMLALLILEWYIYNRRVSI